MSQFFWIQKHNFGPKPRCEHAMVFDSERKCTVLFGGSLNAQGLLNDTWEWNGKNWIQVSDIGPAPRSKHAMAYDNVRKKTILFGGVTATKLNKDTWEWNGEFWTQVANDGPKPRMDHTIAYDNIRNKIVLFGGESSNAELLADTWEWDGVEWVYKNNAGPSARKGHVMVYDSARKQVILFGGKNNESALGDTWTWDGIRWMEIKSFGADPCYHASMVFTGNTSTMFGGHDANKIVFGNTWEWSGKAWTQMQDIGPGPRWGHSMVYDSERKAIILFGGLSNSTENETTHPLYLLGDTWELLKEDVKGTSDIIVSTIAHFPNYYPRDIAIGPNDSIYITLIGDQAGGIPENRIQKLSLTGESAVHFDYRQFEPCGVVIDAENNIYVSVPAGTLYQPIEGQEMNLIKKITPPGEISTFAGSGVPGSADGDGTNAQFNNPASLAIDHNGNIYVTDIGNHCNRKINRSGMVNMMAEISSGVSFDNGNKMYRAINNQIQRITLRDDLVQSGTGDQIGTLTVFQEVLIIAGNGIKGFANGPALSAQFSNPSSVALDANGNIYVADTGNNRIRKIDASGQVTTLAGSGETGIEDGPADVAQFSSPSKIACDSKGNIYVLDIENKSIKKISSFSL